MRWMKHLYIGDQAENRQKELRQRIARGGRTLNAHVLMPAANPQDQVDILPARFLRQPYYRRQEDLIIVGLAGGKADAVQLLLRITDECVRRTGSGDLRQFLAERIREEGTEEIIWRY